jgi:hypothetical protein
MNRATDMVERVIALPHECHFDVREAVALARRGAEEFPQRNAFV